LSKQGALAPKYSFGADRGDPSDLKSARSADELILMEILTWAPVTVKELCTTFSQPRNTTATSFSHTSRSPAAGVYRWLANVRSLRA